MTLSKPHDHHLTQHIHVRQHEHAHVEHTAHARPTALAAECYHATGGGGGAHAAVAEGEDEEDEDDGGSVPSDHGSWDSEQHDECEGDEDI